MRGWLVVLALVGLAEISGCGGEGEPDASAPSRTDAADMDAAAASDDVGTPDASLARDDAPTTSDDAFAGIDAPSTIDAFVGDDAFILLDARRGEDAFDPDAGRDAALPRCWTRRGAQRSRAGAVHVGARVPRGRGPLQRHGTRRRVRVLPRHGGVPDWHALRHRRGRVRARLHERSRLQRRHDVLGGRCQILRCSDTVPCPAPYVCSSPTSGICRRPSCAGGASCPSSMRCVGDVCVEP
jgi:hypothetical protein